MELFFRIYKEVLNKHGLKPPPNLFTPKIGSLSSGDVFSLRDEQYLHQEIEGILLPSPSGVRGQSKKFKASDSSDYLQWRINFYHDIFSDFFTDL